MSACESCGDKTYRELLDDNVRVRQERDEARAEVERLRELLANKREEYTQDDMNQMTSEMIALRKYYEKAAYQRGAEAMREAVFRYAHDDCGFHAMGRAIKGIAIPDDAPAKKEPLTHLACKHCRVNVGIIAAFDTGTLAALMRAFDDHHAECVLDARERENKP